MNNIDISTLSQEEQYKLVQDILKTNHLLKKNLEAIVPNDEDEISLAYIDKLISEDFAKYDEVFRKLA